VILLVVPFVYNIRMLPLASYARGWTLWSFDVDSVVK
jgi:hypothetical protein